ncbi:MAG TPA: ADYC domain-containing protein [Kofleriaceae bacterium]|nr:ADYC domain-containing protein [Kofleriaceae bacterium]
MLSYCLLSAAAALAGGCLGDPDEDPAESQIESDILSANGISLNGISLNGISLNGISLNGISLNGASLSGARVTGTQLQGTRYGGRISGAALVGAKLHGQLTSGGNIDLRIDSSAMLAAPNTDVRTYAISYSTTTGWKPLCVGATGANEAILFPGTWNLTTARHQADWNTFTVSCRGATFAKCEELGYKGDALVDTYLQTCIRALRADYCGDGQSHTVNGTQVNIYDKLGIQADTQAWAIEANWTTEGAICIGSGRVATSLVAPAVPQCMASRATVPCVTSSWQLGVLLRTEVNK